MLTQSVIIAKSDIVRRAYERRSAISANVIDVRRNRQTTFVDRSDVIGALRELAIITDDYRHLLGMIYLKPNFT